MDNDAEVVLSDHATAFVGEDAMRLHQAITLKSCIQMYIDTNGRLIPTRGIGIGKMMRIATSLTGKPYKNSKPQWQQALADLEAFIVTMQAAIPITDNRKK